MMATPRFIDPTTPVPGINPPSCINHLGCERIETAGDHLEPKHFVVFHGKDNGPRDRDRAPALSRRQLLRMGEDQS